MFVSGVHVCVGALCAVINYQGDCDLVCLELLTVSEPQTRGFGVGILRQLKLPPGIIEHSG